MSMLRIGSFKEWINCPLPRTTGQCISYLA